MQRRLLESLDPTRFLVAFFSVLMVHTIHQAAG